MRDRRRGKWENIGGVETYAKSHDKVHFILVYTPTATHSSPFFSFPERARVTALFDVSPSCIFDQEMTCHFLACPRHLRPSFGYTVGIRPNQPCCGPHNRDCAAPRPLCLCTRICAAP